MGLRYRFLKILLFLSLKLLRMVKIMVSILQSGLDLEQEILSDLKQVSASMGMSSMKTFLQLKQSLAGPFLREERKKVVSWVMILSKSILNRVSLRRDLVLLWTAPQREMELRLPQRTVRLLERSPVAVLHHHLRRILDRLISMYRTTSLRLNFK